MAMAKKLTPSEKSQAEATRIIDRVNRESETVAKSSMVRATEHFKKNISGLDGTSDDDDPHIVMGKRIGRSLGWIAVIILIVHLIRTYVL